MYSWVKFTLNDILTNGQKNLGRYPRVGLYVSSPRQTTFHFVWLWAFNTELVEVQSLTHRKHYGIIA
jgi:hypothetical protein